MLLLLTITPCLRSQRKEISQARSYLKSGNLDQAEKLLTDILAKDSANSHNPKIYLLMYQIVQKRYADGNEKLYLKQQYDTASIFNLTKRMFTVLESLDSLDARPDKRGRIKPEYRRKHAAELNAYRPNLYNGGNFFIRKSDYNYAFSFFDAYIDCGRQPLFDSYDYLTTDRRITSAAYWACFCGFKLRDANKTLKYYEVASRDTSKQKHLLRYAAEAYSQKGDEGNYLKSLHEGFNKYPMYPYFFPRLIDCYTQKNRLDSALTIADKALEIDGRNELFLLAKSTLLLNTGRNEECIVVSDTLINVNDTLPDPYFNAGTAYLNKILAIEGKNANMQAVKALIRQLYKQALPYMERYRSLMPDDKEKWAPALYRIYLNLNLGKQFEEIDKILNGK